MREGVSCLLRHTESPFTCEVAFVFNTPSAVHASLRPCDRVACSALRCYRDFFPRRNDRVGASRGSGFDPGL